MFNFFKAFCPHSYIVALIINSSLLILLIHPYIIDLHLLRKNVVVHTHLATPVASDSHIQDQVKFLVERPGRRAFAVVAEAVVLFAIDIKSHLVPLPLHGIGVKTVGKIIALYTRRFLCADGMVV